MVMPSSTLSMCRTGCRTRCGRWCRSTAPCRPAETEVEYEPVTVTVTSPLPETTVLPFATMVTVLPSPPPEATLSAEMVVSFATTHVDVPSTFTVMGASLAVPVPEPAAALSAIVAASVSKSSSVLFCSTTSAVVLVK